MSEDPQPRFPHTIPYVDNSTSEAILQDVPPPYTEEEYPRFPPVSPPRDTPHTEAQISETGSDLSRDSEKLSSGLQTPTAKPSGSNQPAISPLPPSTPSLRDSPSAPLSPIPSILPSIEESSRTPSREEPEPLALESSTQSLVPFLPPSIPPLSTAYSLIENIRRGHRPRLSKGRFPIAVPMSQSASRRGSATPEGRHSRQGSATQPPPGPASGEPMDTDPPTGGPAQQPEKGLVIYDPPPFEVVMKDAPEMALAPGIANPPQYLMDLHQAMTEVYLALQTVSRDQELARTLGKQHLKDQYDQMRSMYQAAVASARNNWQVQQQQLEAFQQQVQRDSHAFSKQVWTEFLKADRNAADRVAAVKHLNEATARHEQYFEQLAQAFKEQRAFNADVEGWAKEKERQLADVGQKVDAVTARPVVTRPELDNLVQTQIAREQQQYQEGLKDQVRSLFEEYHTNLARGQTPDLDSYVNAAIKSAKAQSSKSSAFVTQPSSRAPKAKYSSTESRLMDQIRSHPTFTDPFPARTDATTVPRNGLTSQELRTEQVRQQQARAQQERDTTMMSGAGGGGRQPPRNNTAGAPGDPDDDDSDESDDPPRFPRNPRRIPRLPEDDPFESRFSQPPNYVPPPAPPAISTVTPIQLVKPTTYNGKDKAKFRSWWDTVLSYIQAYEGSFISDQLKINWVGSLLTDKAQTWHQSRKATLIRLRNVDTWTGYAAGIRERFHDPGERFRNERKIKEAKYKNDISEYLTEILDLNDVVQWSGTTFQTQISKPLPKEIVQEVYRHLGRIPSNDEEFINALEQAGLLYESMLANPVLNPSGKEGPISKQEHSKSGQQRAAPAPGRERSSKPGQDQSSKKDRKSEKLPRQKQIWTNVASALVGIDQTKIDQRKKDKCSCWRCGRNNHFTTECLALKDTDGKLLPPVPGKTSSAKRKREEEKNEDPVKKAKIDAVHARIPPEDRFTVIDDSDESSF